MSSGYDAAELLSAGADAVQVGTASFVDPKAPVRVLAELADWCASHGFESVAQLVGTAHRGTRQEAGAWAGADRPRGRNIGGGRTGVERGASSAIGTFARAGPDRCWLWPGWPQAATPCGHPRRLPAGGRRPSV